jgi:RND superfamily putative drug exporter
MFAALALFASKYKVLIIIFWIALAGVLTFLAPPLSRVGVTDDTQFLPENTQSTQAQTLLETRFSGASRVSPGSALIVIYDPQGLSQSDEQAARALHDWLLSREAPAAISGVTSVFNTPALSSTLVSQDGTAMLISLSLAEASSSAPARQAVEAIRAHVRELTASPQIYVTGNAGVSTDILTSIQETIDKATLVTIILVMVLLLLIYRSPVAILVPLITIGVSYLISRGITGYIAASGVNVSSLVDAYLVVTLFGIGTDYCLFMVSRFKEELLEHDRRQAGRFALQRIGPVILASAVTVIVALLCLGISQFGMNRTSGYMLAIGVAVTLAAGLTLTPALISLFGEKLLWPAKLKTRWEERGGLWKWIGELITRRPAVLAVALLIVLMLPYIALPRINYSASMLDQMPRDIGSVEGYNITRRHFPPGEFNPLTLVIESHSGTLLSPAALSSIVQAGEALKKVADVTQVKYFSAPAGQLAQWSQESETISSSLSLATIGQLSFFQSLGQGLQDLAIQYPDVQQSLNFQQVAAGLQQIKVDTAVLQNIPGLLPQIKQTAAAISAGLAALKAEFVLQADSPFSRSLRSFYFSQDGTLTRIDIILATDPFASASLEAVSHLRGTAGQILQATGLSEATYYLGGTSAAQADILKVNGTDFLRVLGLAVIGILLVMIVLLRSILAPVYMVLTVLLNFGATLGLATWIFLDVLKQNTIIYMLPIFVFVILIAVGSDYNIFLVSRIREECHRKTMKEAICQAVASTGGVITSCGIILAGTFATLTTAPLQMVFQVGAAIAVGVIMDTFLVRAIVIPSLATIAGRWSWWPSRLYRRKEPKTQKTL